MKTKSVLLAALLSASVLAFANEPGSSKVAVVNSKESAIFKVIYAGEAKGTVTLNILDNAGSVVYHEKIKNIENFARPLNFSGMTPGEYTIEIADNTGNKIQRKVSYATKASLNNVRITKTGEAGKYLFSVANQGPEEVTVKIYNDASELVHDQTVTINGKYGVVYNLKEISGEPTFTVTDKTGTVAIK